MIIQKIFFTYILILLTGCGYNPIYSNKNMSKISINKINTTGDEKINRKLLSLLNIKTNDEFNNSFFVDIKSRKERGILSKDKQGNPLIYNVSLEITVSLNQIDKKEIKSKKFNSSHSYSNQKNKFELSREERNIEENLIQSIAEKIILFLYS